MRHNLSLHAAGREDLTKPKSCGTCAKERQNKVVEHIMEGMEIRKALKGVLKDKILNKWGSEIWVKGAVLIHYMLPKCSLSPYLMSGTTLGSGTVNMSNIFSCPQGEGETGKVNYSAAKASWRK